MYNRCCEPTQTPSIQTPSGRSARNADLSPARHFAPLEHNALAANEVSVDLLYCGVGSPDIELARARGRKHSPVLIGHEIIGRIRATGQEVTRFEVGDIVGVGALAASCGTCEHCRDNLEQYCLEGPRQTRDYQHGRMHVGKAQPLADNVVVTEPFLIRIPPGADLPTMAPLLGAAIATYSAMQHWKLESGQNVGVIGMGGLGHMAVKLAAARGARVTVFTTSSHKVKDAKRFGADQAILWNDEAAFERLAGRFDLLISTVPHAYSVNDFMDLLKLNATLVNVGTTEELQDACGTSMSRGRRSVAGSLGGGIAETQAVLDYCAANDIRPEIEMIRPDQMEKLLENPADNTARYRYVIDFASARHH